MSKGPKSKGISARNRENETCDTPVQTPVSWGRRIWFGLRFPALLAVGVILVVIWIWLTSENPNQLLQEAKDVVAKNPVLAEQLLEKCLAVRPDFPEAQLLRCRVLGGLGYWEEAYGMFQLIKRPASLPGPALMEFTRQALSARQYSLAHVVGNAARQADSSSIASTRLLLEVCLQQGLQNQSLELSRALTTLSPEDSFPWQAMARIYQDQDQPAKAAEAYRNTLRCQLDLHEQQQIRIQLTRMQMELGEISGARETITTLLDHGSPTTEVRLLEATVLRYEGNTQEAVQAVQRILDEQPSLVPAIYLRGLIFFDMGRLEVARDDFLRVIQLEPRRGEAHYNLAQTYQRLGETEHAREALLLAKKLGDDAAGLRAIKYRISQGAKDAATLQRFRELSREAQGR